MRRSVGAPPGNPAAVRLIARGLLLPLVAGAACVAGFAPFYVWPVPVVSLAILFHVWSRSATPRQAALSGFAFGLGYFLAGVSWVFVSLHEFGSMPAALAAAATFLFCAFLALYFALPGWVTARIAATPASRLVAAAAATTLSEWLRGWVFTGFPWLNLGTSQAPGGPLAGLAPYAGAYGVSLAVAAAAALSAALVASRSWSRGRAPALAGLAAIFAAGAIGGTVEWTRPAGARVTVALVQGNVAQQLKWRDEMRMRILDDYRAMILAARARIVILPETALPAFLDQLPADYVAGLRAHARESGKEILMGTVERNARGGETDYFNSLFLLTAQAGHASYHKRHLVPFGEFIPAGFGWILSVLRIPLTDFARGAPAQPPIVAAGIPLGVAICYEDIFGEEVIEQLPAAQLLVNVSNDAWFGRSLAADQHLQASQMRALETGRWMVRSTNTGVSAAIDPRGRVASRLPAFTAGTLVEAVEPRTGMTPYARVGNLPAVSLALALLALAAFRRRR